MQNIKHDEKRSPAHGLIENEFDKHKTRTYLPEAGWARFSIVCAFSLGILLTVIVLCLLPVRDAQRYSSLKGAMTRVSDVHQRITENSTPIDVGFIGTSHTWNGISDSEIQLQLTNQSLNIFVANLASSWMGRDMHLFILRQLLAHKKPKLVVIELNEHEYPYSHNVLPYVGDISDILCCKPYLDPLFPSHFALFLKQQAINSVQFALANKDSNLQIAKGDFGWLPLDKVMNDQYLPINQPASLKQRLKERAYVISALYGFGIVEQMVELANANGVKVAFLYLPEYKYARRDPVVPIENYKKLAPVMRIPLPIGSNASFWDDPAHLNRKGALELVPTIAKDIREMIILESSTAKDNRLDGKFRSPSL